MTLLLLLVLLGLVLDNVDLLVLAVLYDISSNLSTLNCGIADHCTVVVGINQYFVEYDCSSFFSAELFKKYDVALLNLLLLSASLEYCKHEKHLSFIIRLAAYGNDTRGIIFKKPSACGNLYYKPKYTCLSSVFKKNILFFRK